MSALRAIKCQLLFTLFVESRSYQSHRNKRRVENATELMTKINKLLLQLCQSQYRTCASGPPGPPGQPGPKGTRVRRGQKGRTGNKGDKGIMGSPGKSGKQGIMGPKGLKGDTGIKGQKGDIGATGMPGTKGEPGQSISSPAVVVSPATLTVNEGGSASFQCSASGNPEPAIVWSKVDNQTEISQSAVSGGKLQLKHVTGNDSGTYQCSATNILGKDQAAAQLGVNGTLSTSFYIKPRDYFLLIKLSLIRKITLTEWE